MRPQPEGPADHVDLAEQFAACLDQKFDLCVALEALADSLPLRIDCRAALNLMGRLQPTLAICHRLEETMVFPVVMITARDIGPTLERLRTEHLEDEDQAEDVSAAIAAYLEPGPRSGADKIGYMLRGLFTPMRRHIAFEREFILPRLRRDAGT